MSRVTRKKTPVVEDDKNSELTDLFDELSGDSKRIVKILMREFEALKSQISSKNLEIADLKENVSSLQKKVQKLETMIDDADAYERRDTVILSGSALPAYSIGENCVELTRGIIKRDLKIELPIHEINTVHRLGKKPLTQAPDKRPIIIKLCRRDTKSQLISAARRTKTPGFFINESLTVPRRKILYALRQIKRSHPNLVTGCNSYEGKIFAYTKTTGNRDERHLVNTYQNLVKFCDEHIKMPIQTFLTEWQY